MIQEWKDAADTKIYSKKFTKNTSFVFAWSNSIYEVWKTYITQYKQIIIQWASHVFTEEWAEKQLFDETLNFLVG
jgi:hypothetical protein